MLNFIILFLIRLKLGVKKREYFQFANQKSKYDTYYFDDFELMKIGYDDDHNLIAFRPAHVSLNWLLHDDCKIKKVD